MLHRRLHREPAEAGDREHRLDDDGAAEDADEHEPDDGHDRDRGVAQRVLEDDRAARDARRAQRADERPLHHVAHRVACLLGDHRERRDRERQHRQHEAARPLRRVLRERHVAGGREHLDRDGEPRDEDQPQQEVGDRQPHERDRVDGAPERAAAQRARDPERDADGRGRQRRQPDEPEARRDATVEQGRDRLRAEGRVAQVALGGMAQPLPVARRQRLIESERLAYLQVLLLRRLDAHERPGDVAGDQRNQQERRSRDDEQQRERERQTSADQSQHGAATSARRAELGRVRDAPLRRRRHARDVGRVQHHQRRRGHRREPRLVDEEALHLTRHLVRLVGGRRRQLGVERVEPRILASERVREGRVRTPQDLVLRDCRQAPPAEDRGRESRRVARLLDVVAAVRGDRRLDGDADSRKLAGERLRERVLADRVDRNDRQREAVGVARLRQQRSRLGGVVGVAVLQLGVVGVVASDGHLVDDLAVPAAEQLRDRLAVDRVVDRLPHAHVAERLEQSAVAVAELQRHHQRHRRDVSEPGALGGVERRDRLVLDQLHLTGLERLERGAGVADRLDDDLVPVDRVLVPVVGVRDVRVVVARDRLRSVEHVGAGADRERSERAVLDGSRAARLADLLKLAEDQLEQRGGRSEVEREAERAGDVNRSEVAQICAPPAAGIVGDVLEPRLDRLRVEARAVAESDVRPQSHAEAHVSPAVAPLERQAGREAAVGLLHQQRVVGEVVVVTGAVLARRRVERRREAWVGDRQQVAALGAGGRGGRAAVAVSAAAAARSHERDERERRGHQPRPGTSMHLSSVLPSCAL